MCEGGTKKLSTTKVSSRGVVANLLNFAIVVSEFELQLRNYVHFQTNIFGKGMNSFFSRLWVK